MVVRRFLVDLPRLIIPMRCCDDQLSLVVRRQCASDLLGGVRDESRLF